MPNILPANRIAALATWLTALGALIAAVEGTLPAAWMNTALAIGALVTKLAVTLHFMTGSQKFDQIAAGPAPVRPESAITPDGPPAV